MRQENLDNLEAYAEELREMAQNEEDPKERAKLHEQYMDAMERLQVLEHDDREFLDKKERRRIDEERNRTANELEKQKVIWARVETLVKVFGIAFPAILSVVTYWKVEDRIGELEENGRWTTDAGRKNHQNSPKLPWCGK